MMITKVCTKCGVEKPLGEYNKNKRSKDGLGVWCRCCCIEYRKHYYKKNKARMGYQSAQWCKSNPEKRKDISRRYRGRNQEKVREYEERRVERLMPSYVKKNIRKQYNIDTADITPDMIEMKRRNIKYYRELNQLKKLTK